MIYIKNISLKNFKCFEYLPIMDFGKISLLTGANSSGKSSILYSILGILQSEEFPLELQLNGKYVNLGSYGEVVYKGDKNKNISIDFTLEDDERNISYSFETTWCNNDKNQPTLVYLVCKTEYFILTLNNLQAPLTYNLDYYPQKNPQMAQGEFLNMFQKMSNGKFENGSTVPNNQRIIATEYVKFVTEETHLQHIIADKDLKNSNYNVHIKEMLPLTLVMDELKELRKRYDIQLNYISSYRMPSQRTYIDKPVTGGKISSFGDGFVYEMLNWQENNKQKFEKMIASLRKLGLLHDISSERTERGESRVGVKIHEQSTTVALSDVGFGISQILPVIVGDIELGEQSSLFTSQPEIHLHPSVQAELGDYFVEQIKYNKRYLIETHSEYLLNRLRLDIVKGTLKEEDIKVYYLSQEEDKSILYTITFTRSGQILGAPEEFFETYMVDTMNIAMEAE